MVNSSIEIIVGVCAIRSGFAAMLVERKSTWQLINKVENTNKILFCNINFITKL
jgi:hypothetical protein